MSLNMGLFGKLFGRSPERSPQFGKTLKLEMAVEIIMATWLYRLLSESGIPNSKVVKIVEQVARAEVFQTTQKNAVEQASAKVQVPAMILEKYHLVEALIGYYEGQGNRAAVSLVRSQEYPAIEKLIKTDMTITGKSSMPDYMRALENESTEAYRLQNAALIEWCKANC